MRDAIRAYWRSLWQHGRLALSGAVVGGFGVALSIHPVVMPAWFWFLLAIASALWVGFLAYLDAHKELVALRSDAGADERRDYVEKRLNDSLSRVHAELSRNQAGQPNAPDLVAEMNLASSLCGEAFGPLEAMKLHVPASDPSEFFERLRAVADRFPTMQVRRDFDRDGFEQVKAFYDKKPRPTGINVTYKAVVTKRADEPADDPPPGRFRRWLHRPDRGT